jgi:hypothetical protein
MSEMNDDYGIDLGTEPAKPKKVTKAANPETDRENWPVIHIESEEGKPNYEFLAVQGTLPNGKAFGHELQVQRGVDVAVPPSIVLMLRDAIATHMRQVRNPQTGLNDRVFSDRSAIPWRLIKGGKYLQ